MRYKAEKDILVITESTCGFGFRLVCNLPPEEMKKRKEEVIRSILEQWKFNWDIELYKEGSTPNPCRDLNGFWSYFVTLE